MAERKRKSRVTDQIAGDYVTRIRQGALAADRAAMEHRTPRPNPFASDRQAALTGLAASSSFVPVLGDVTGLLADSAMYADDPASRNWKNYLLTAASTLPVVPAASVLRGAKKAAKVASLPPAALEADLAARGFKRRNLKGKSVWVGAPPGVSSPEDVLRLADDYAARVEAALDAGVDPNYFYKSAEDALLRISPDAGTARKMGEINAITSSENPVRSNFGHAVQAFEQRNAGQPIVTGRYPGEMGPKIEDVLAGNEPHLGMKRHRYGQGISGVGRRMPDSARRAPNDRFEIMSVGYRYTKDNPPPKAKAGQKQKKIGDYIETASEQQHYFIDGVRQIAREKVNAKRGLNLDVFNAQELNWATARADRGWWSGTDGMPPLDDGMKLKITESSGDNIQDSLDYFTTQHSWETVPGKKSGVKGIDLKAHDSALTNILVDAAHKRDRVIDAFGGTFQQPPITGPGVFGEDVHPFGHQSMSLGYHSYGDFAPATADRIRATEMTRGYGTLQDAVAASLQLPSARATVPSFGGSLNYRLTDPLGTQEASLVNEMLNARYGVGNTGIVPTPAGVSILSTGAKGLERSATDIANALGTANPVTRQAEVGQFGGTGLYKELPWTERKATETVLDSYTPAMRARADSDEMRLVQGQLAEYWGNLEKSGTKLPTGYVDVLKAWSTGGIDAVEKMVKQGTAPVLALSILAQAERRQAQKDSGQPRGL